MAVLMNGRLLAVQWLADSIPAILETCFLGVEHVHAVADVLFGDFNLAGRLPVSFPRVTRQVPIYYNHRPVGRRAPGTPTGTAQGTRAGYTTGPLGSG